jgi:hypothetical protein
MPGLLANSASKTQTVTSADATSTGYVTGERVVLTTTPTGTDYAWAISLPSGSSPVRARLSSATAAAPTFTPDIGGTYTIVCTVDGSTTYVLRITVTAIALSVPTEVLRLAPVADASVPAPAVGLALYYSATQSALCVKNAAGAVFPVDLGAAV